MTVDPELRKRFEEWQVEVCPYLFTAELTARFLLAELERLPSCGDEHQSRNFCPYHIEKVFNQFLALCQEKQK